MNDALFRFNISTSWHIVKVRLCQSWWLHTERSVDCDSILTGCDTHESCFSSGCVLVPNTMYLRSMRAPIYQHYSTKRHTCQHLISNSPVCLQMSEIMHHTSCSMKRTHPRVSAVVLCMIRGVWWRACNCRTLYIYTQTKKTSKHYRNTCLIGMNQPSLALLYTSYVLMLCSPSSYCVDFVGRKHDVHGSRFSSRAHLRCPEGLFNSEGKSNAGL